MISKYISFAIIMVTISAGFAIVQDVQVTPDVGVISVDAGCEALGTSKARALCNTESAGGSGGCHWTDTNNNGIFDVGECN